MPDGDIECMGRADDQVKVRGFRIELGEIETVLGEIEGVRQTVVDVVVQDASDHRLIGYYVLDESAQVSSLEIRKHLRGILPAYMNPQQYVQLEAIPLTPNGKVDRRALPKPNSIEGSDTSNYVAPATKIESMIAEIWQDSIKCDCVSAYDNFFDIGGHSLLAVAVVARIKRETKVKVPLRSMVLMNLREIAKTYLNDDSQSTPVKSTSTSLFSRVFSRFSNRENTG